MEEIRLKKTEIEGENISFLAVKLKSTKVSYFLILPLGTG